MMNLPVVTLEAIFIAVIVRHITSISAREILRDFYGLVIFILKTEIM